MLSAETNDYGHIPEANFENNIRSLEFCIRLVLQNSRASDIMFYQAYILNSSNFLYSSLTLLSEIRCYLCFYSIKTQIQKQKVAYLGILLLQFPHLKL
jgi:hypothetical protein